MATVQDENDHESLGDRIKGYEQTHSVQLAHDLPFTVRLDGHCFSKLTSGLNKPFDAMFAGVMDLVCADLLLEFNPQTIYTQSDEISMLFYPNFDETGEKLVEGWTPIFNGRVEKLVSLTAAFATARFNYHVSRVDLSGYKPETRDKLLRQRAYFDGRAFSLPDPVQMANHIIWRCAYDCVRNSTLNMALKVLGEKAVHGVNTVDQRKMMLEKGVDWNEMPPRYKYGAFFKKEQYETEVVVPKGPQAGQTVKTLRTRVAVFYEHFNRADEDRVKMLYAKYR